jgi:hypothetical protein
VKIGDALHATVTAVTKPWTKVQRKKLRDQERRQRALERYLRETRHEPSIKDIAFEVMAEAYRKASGLGRYPAHARQIMYQARPRILAGSDKPLGKDFDQYFTQTLLPEYLRCYPDETAAWDVVYDARGHLEEPHTTKVVSLGTLDVRAYLTAARNGASGGGISVTSIPLRFPTTGPHGRYRNVLFLEKEGFNDLLDAAGIAKRFDLAIMSTKGYSSTAARRLIEDLPGVRFLVLHDCDKDGLGIVHTLRHDTARYQFRRRPEVIDLGLRLPDVEAEGLGVEPVSYTRSVRRALERYGATAQEIAFLQRHRVELNAFTSDHFVEWLERKLRAHHVTKLIPDAHTLGTAYRYAVGVHHLNAGLTDLARAAKAVAAQAGIPKDLARQVTALLRAEPALAWDDAVARVAATRVALGGNGRRARRGRKLGADSPQTDPRGW